MAILADSHNHSTQSPDGDNTPHEMAERALKLGIEHYTLTDHVEIDKYECDGYEKPVSESAEILAALKEEYKGRLHIMYGVELGQPLRDVKLAESVLDRFDYDFVLGSLHCCRNYSYFGVTDELLVPAILTEYFDELIAMAEWGKFDVLSHITYPLRYLIGESGLAVDMEQIRPAIVKLLETAVRNNLGIEINTSGLRKRFGKTMPSADIVQKYYDLGGRILTVGSDAHRTDDLGKGIDAALDIAKECGFKEICIFEKRKPKFLKI